MATANTNDHSEEVLRREIIEQARSESERLVATARREAQTLLAEADDEARKERQTRLDTARAEADRRRELILATVPVEANRMESARVEALLQSIKEAARQQLQTGTMLNERETIVALAADALRRMVGEAFVIKLTRADRAGLTEGLIEEIARQTGRPSLLLTLAEDTWANDRGVVIEDAAGRLTWDNRLQARLERLWPELRRQIAVQAKLVEAGKNLQLSTASVGGLAGGSP